MEPTTSREYGHKPIGATALRNNWTDVLQRTCNLGNIQPIDRNGRPAAVLVPTWWFRTGTLLRHFHELYETHRISSNTARQKCSEMLTKIAEHGHRVIITVDGYEVCVFVPRPWADEVASKLNRNAE